jgi:hypothetical protein
MIVQNSVSNRCMNMTLPPDPIAEPVVQVHARILKVAPCHHIGEITEF